MPLRIVVHPAHLRVASSLAQLLGDEVEVIANRHMPIGEVWLMSVPDEVEWDYDSFRPRVAPSVDLPSSKSLITKIV
jgi:hypothetical protein